MSALAPLILSTRPEPAAGRLVDELRRLGYRALSAPMLRYRREARLTPAALAACDGVVFASAAAARFAGEDLAGAEPGRPAFCVGDATTAAARDAGFSEARSAGGDAADLLRLLDDIALRRPLILRGADVAVDIAAALRAKSAKPAEITLYRAEPADALPEDVLSALAAGDVAAALFTSARTAEAFAAAAEGLDLAAVTALAISPRTASALPAERFFAVQAAQTPTEAALIGLLIATIPTQH